jgi:hypothetical protein
MVELHNQIMVAMARCMLKAKALPGYFRCEAVVMTIHILNRLSTHVVARKTSYEAWHGVATIVHYMRTFSSIAHVKVTHPGLKKLDDRSWQTIFIGWESGSKAYHCYDLVAQRVIKS